MSLANPTVTAPLRPKYITDDYGTHEDDYGVGGQRTVQSVADLSTIALKRRKSYMKVVVRNYLGSPRDFWLASPDNNSANLANNAYWIPVPYSDWIPVAPSGGYIFKGKFDASTGIVSTGDYAGQTLADTPIPAVVQAGWYWQADTAGTNDFGTTVSVVAEILDSGDAVTTNFTGAFGNTPINVGTVSITDGTQVITDDGAGNLIGDVNGGGNNTIDYKTGIFDVTFASAPPNVVDNIVVTYDYGEHIFTIGDRAIWNGSSFDIDEQQNASNSWATITGMPSIISDIGDGTFIPVSQTDFNTLEAEVDLNTAKLVTLVLGAGIDITAINNTDIITKQMLTNNYYNVTDIDNLETDLQADIAALLDDSATTADTTVGSFTNYVGHLVSTYTSNKIENRLLDVYNAAIADAPGGNVYASLGMVTGTFDGITLAIDLGEKADKILPPIVGNVVQTLTTGYSIDNSGATTIITFSGTVADFGGVKYEIHYLKGIGDALETDPIFTASEAFSITSTNKSNWTEAYNNYIVSGNLSGTNLILTQRDGGSIGAIDLSSLSAGAGFALNPLTYNYLSKSNLAGDNITNSQVFDNGTDIGIFTTTLTSASFTVRKSVNTKPLAIFDNTNLTGTALRVSVPTSGTGKLLSGYKGVIENFSVSADAKITGNQLVLNSVPLYSIGSPSVLILNNTTKEVSILDGTLNLDFILSNGASSPTRTGITKNWQINDLALSERLIGNTTAGQFKGISVGQGLNLTTNTLNVGGTFNSNDISLVSTTERGFDVTTGDGSYTSKINIDNTGFSYNYLNGTVDSKFTYSTAFNEFNWEARTDGSIYSSILQQPTVINIQGGTGFEGLKYGFDYSANWGTVNTSNRHIPDIGWIVDNYLSLSGGTLTGALTFSPLAGTEKLTYVTAGGVLSTVTLDSSLALAAGVLSATGGSGATTLAALSDTTISSPSTNHVLKWNGSSWAHGFVAYANVTGTPSLATVATSGSYNDLSSKPTIPAAQVNSDWTAISGISQILNKPTLATVATSGSYNDLSSKPTIYTTLASLTDTSVSTIASNHYLGYNGSAWINRQIAYSEISGVPSLATVATTGNYNSLSNLPSIPSLIQTTSTWTPITTPGRIVEGAAYFQIGNAIFLYMTIKMENTLSDSTGARISGLPGGVINTLGTAWDTPVVYGSGEVCYLYLESITNVISLRSCSTGAELPWSTFANKRITLSVFYLTD